MHAPPVGIVHVEGGGVMAGSPDFKVYTKDDMLQAERERLESELTIVNAEISKSK